MKRQKTPEEYAEFIEDMEAASVETARDFEAWSGYSPSWRQRLLLLARSRRENWKGSYRKVIRDKRGRFVSWRKWTWRKEK